MEQNVAVGLMTGAGVAGITGSVLLGAVAGAIVGLCISPVPVIDRILSSIAALAIGVAGAQPLSAYLELSATLSGGVALLLSLFGVPIVLEGRAIIADGAIRELVARFLKSKSGGDK